MSWALLLFSAGLGIVLRIVLRFKCPDRRGTDTYYHLLLAESIRRNGLRVPRRIEAFTLEKVLRSPWHFHQWLALLPVKARERLEPYFGAIIDTIHLGLVAVFSAWLAGQPKLAVFQLEPLKIAGLAALLFATYPGLLVLGVGPRMHEASPRPLGQLYFSMALLGGIVYSATQNWWALGASLLAGGLMLLTSKFAMQVLLFLAPLLGMLAGSWFLVALPVLVVPCALFLSGGRYKDLLYGQVMHLAYYRNRLLHPAVNHRNSFKDLLRIPRLLRDDPGQVYYLLSVKNSWLIAIVRNPMLWLLIALVAVRRDSLAWPALTLTLELSLLPLLPFCLTSFRPLRFLGEAERYLEFGVPATCAILPLLLSMESTWLIWGVFGLLLIYSCLFVGVDYRITYRNDQRFWRQGRELQEKVILWLRAVPWSALILPVPASWMRYRIPGETHHHLLDFGMDWGMHRIAEIDRLWSRYYPYPQSNLGKISCEYQVDLIVCKLPIDPPPGSGLVYDFSPFDKVYENQQYVIYAASPRARCLGDRGEGIEALDSLNHMVL
jgi:hypothetical protein